jgi:hypothetical protein
MSTDLVTLRRLVRQRLGVPQSDDFFPDAVLTDTINEAATTVDAEARWPWTETTVSQALVAGATSFPVSADWRATRALFNGYDEMQYMSPTDVMSAGGAGAPEIWSVSGGSILVAPAPSSSVALTHYYYRQTPDLVNDADLVVTPDQYVPAIVCKAAELLSAREDDSVARQTHAGDYAKWIVRMSRDLRRSTGPVRVRVRPGGWI